MRPLILFLFIFTLNSCSQVELRGSRSPASFSVKSCFSAVKNLTQKKIRNEVATEKSLAPSRVYSELYEMDSKYRGEELGQSEFKGFGESKVKYFTEQELEEREIFFTSKGMFTQDDLVSCERCEYIIVIDEFKKIYGDIGKKGVIQHSSFFSGDPVASAGSLLIEKGIVTAVSNRSGHYLPDEKGLLRIFDMVISKQNEIPNRVVFMNADGSPTTYNTREIISRYLGGLSGYDNERDEFISQGIIEILKNHNKI